jgi:DNA-binding beta-propeller fold protein YncE
LVLLLILGLLSRGGPGSIGLISLLAPSAEAQVLRSPVRIALSPEGNLLVSDYTREAIFTLDAVTLEAVDVFYVEDKPLAVGQLGDRLYVGNASLGCVDVCEIRDNKIKFLYALGGEKKKEAIFIRKPTDLAIDDSQGLVFVLDGGEKVVKVFNSNDDLLYTIPRGGRDEGVCDNASPIPDSTCFADADCRDALHPDGTCLNLLKNPTAIAVDEDREEVLVSDYGDPGTGNPPARIQIFNYAGDLIGQVNGNSGPNDFRFSRPQGLAVDSGRIFMVDCVLGKVLVFDRITGYGVATIGSFGTNPGQLFAPTDIVIDKVFKDVYVTSTNPARIEVFREGGQIP